MSLRVMSAAALFMSAAAFGGISAANAADLGGGCCADLEERVAELEATTVRKGNRKVSVTVYGQVTTGILYFNNGDTSDTYYGGDNSNTPSRFGFRGSAKISPTLSAGFNIEVSVQSAPFGSVTAADDDAGQPGDGALGLRQAHWYLEHTKLGKVSVGRVSAAMDGIQEVDLVGTNLVSLPGINIGGKIAIGGTGFNWDQFTRGFDGDRVNAIRYDSPTFGGFVASASFGENDRWDVTLRYAGELSGFRVAWGIGYGVGTDNTDVGLSPYGAGIFDEVRFTSGSISVWHTATGLFATAFAGKREFSLTTGYSWDETNWGLRAGIAKNFFGIGNTVLYGEYNSFDNINDGKAGLGGAAGTEGEIWGIGLIQNIDAAAMELFVSYKVYSTDATGAEDMDLIFSGARIRF